MSLAKILSVCLISFALLCIAQSRRLDDYSSEDDHLNEISEEDGRRVIVPDLERLFSSAEMEGLRRSSKATKKIKRQGLSLPDLEHLLSNAEIQEIRRSSKASKKIKRQGAETSQSSKHAHGMITSMLSFVSNVIGFGRSFIGNE